jgi:hypothetical protein
MEVWRSVVGYEGFYEVSNFGRVRRADVQPPRVLKPGIMRGRGLRNVSLCVGAKPKSYAVHRLVALAFLGPPPSDRHQVAHNDGNASNNRLVNLRWATPAENSFDQVRHGTQKGHHHGRGGALTDAQVLAIRSDHRTEASVARDYGIAPGTVGQIRRRETYKHLKAGTKDYVPPRPRRVFSDDDVRAIRADSRSTKELAVLWRCSTVTIWAVRTRRSYPQVPDAPVDSLAVPASASAPVGSHVELVGDVGLVALTRNQTAIFDAADLPRVKGRYWQATKGKNTFYAAAQERSADGRLKKAFLHRVLLDVPDGFVVDHINGDGLDNRRQNLRIVTVAQNNLNSRVRRDCVSGLKGALYDRRKDRYYSRIKADGRYVWLGYFSTAIEAAEAYAKASAKHHGDYGRSYLDDRVDEAPSPA